MAALVVEKMIENPGEITAGSADAISEALDAYNALLPRQKELVSSTALSTLNSALDVWKEKYEFSGLNYQCKTVTVTDANDYDISKSSSVLVIFIKEKEQMTLKIEDHDEDVHVFDPIKVVCTNQYGTYFGTTYVGGN